MRNSLHFFIRGWHWAMGLRGELLNGEMRGAVTRGLEGIGEMGTIMGGAPAAFFKNTVSRDIF